MASDEAGAVCACCDGEDCPGPILHRLAAYQGLLGRLHARGEHEGRPEPSCRRCLTPPVRPPVTAETVEAHMRAEHCPKVHAPGACGLGALATSWAEAHETNHATPPPRLARSDGTPAFGHTHSPPAADEGTTE